MTARRGSLALRLSLTMAAILGISFFAWMLIVHRSTTAAFVESRQEWLAGPAPAADTGALRRQLEQAWARDGWSGVRAIAGGEPGGTGTAAEFLVVDVDLDVVAATDPALLQARAARGTDGELHLRLVEATAGGAAELELTQTDPLTLMDRDGNAWGTLVLLPPTPAPEHGERFASGVLRSAAISLAAAMLLAVAATLLVLRRSLAPVDRMTRAARQLQHGEIPQPVGEVRDAELRELALAFDAAVEAIDRTARMRRQLVADVAHELRTPVTNVKAQLEACRQGLVQPDAELVETLRREARLLERLVEDFQQLAQSDAGQLRVDLQPLPLAETVANVLSPMAESAGASLEVRLPAEIEVIADEERLRQVLGNLMDNSVRHRPSGLAIGVVLAQGRTEDSVDFLFTDNGPGIDAADRPYVFDRLYRAERSRSRATGGAGLGLSIARGLVKAMGGEIGLEETGHGGVSFRITLPRAAS